MVNPASFPVVLGDFRCDVTCQACRENSPRTLSYSVPSLLCYSDSANSPGYEAGVNRKLHSRDTVPLRMVGLYHDVTLLR